MAFRILAQIYVVVSVITAYLPIRCSGRGSVLPKYVGLVCSVLAFLMSLAPIAEPRKLVEGVIFASILTVLYFACLIGYLVEEGKANRFTGAVLASLKAAWEFLVGHWKGEKALLSLMWATGGSWLIWHL